jgi:glyoxylate/hydroxypyruvate reductase A
MTQFTIVVDCNDPQYTREICAAFALFPEVKAVLPEPRRPRGALRLLLVSRPQLLARSPVKIIQAASAGVDHLPDSLFASDCSALPGGG